MNTVGQSEVAGDVRPESLIIEPLRDPERDVPDRTGVQNAAIHIKAKRAVHDGRSKVLDRSSEDAIGGQLVVRIGYTREATTEKRNGPDFLFPGEKEYHDPGFSTAMLTMLGAKTSCKDRWRQVLAEAHRIEEKHLVTLQPGISETQTSEMQAERLQLVVPRPIFSLYAPTQQDWLMDVGGFLELVTERQA